SNYYLNNFLSLSSMDDTRQDAIYKILGELMLSQNNNEDAIWYLSRYSDDSDETEYTGVKNKLIELYENKKQYAEVKKVAVSLLKKFADNKDAMKWEFYKSKAKMHLDSGKSFSQIVTSFKKRFQKTDGYKIYLGRLYIDYVYIAKEMKNFKFAANAIKSASKLKVNEQKPHILYLRGYLATVQNKDKDALKYLSEFTGKYTNSEYLTNVYITLGHLFYRSEKKADALEAYNKAVNAAKNPNDLELALNNLIVLNKELGFWDGVLKSCRQYLNSFPDHFTKVEKQIWIGLSYSRLNRFDESTSYLKKIKPFAGSEREPEIQFYIGEAYFNAGRYQEAISEFLKIPLLSKKTELQWEASALYFAGQAYERLGKNTEAIHMYNEIVKRPGILWELKKEAQKKIARLK
ncbi:MAG: tetratricopeptide repeat protein, partial [Calditrichia bacterium]|nr:tetratricopeptide repeat protein [Calditrichia bacterium]